jgi:uridine kinase
MADLKKYAIYCENNGTEKKYPFGTTLKEIIDDQKIDIGEDILGAMVNFRLKELDYMIYKPKSVRFIGFSHPAGRRMYERSMVMVLFKALYDLYPKYKLKIEHSVPGGLYCELQNGHGNIKNIAPIVPELKKRMEEIIANDFPFEREELRTEKALKIFEEFGLEDKCTLIRTRHQYYSSVYKLDNVVNYFYGYLVPSTRYLKNFDLVTYFDGFVLVLPQSENPDKLQKVEERKKLFEIYQEFKEWVNIVGVPNVGKLNELVLEKRYGDVIKVSEALQEKKVACIAEMIHSKKTARVVFISGPSSSGKTTFAKRLAVQLAVIGFKPTVISMDNYFVDREFTPRDENGNYDFESPKALDLKLFNDNIIDLINGKEIDVPKFNFAEGKKYFDGTKMKLKENGIIIVEGIHGLNPKISAPIPEERKFKVSVSALTPLNIDSNNRIPTTDNRLIRRMVRDAKYRGYSALETLTRWPSVRAGEEKHIFPFQENADAMFNSALVYELGVLKRWAMPLLHDVPPDVPEYSEARRLLKFLSYFVSISEREIPPTSILREFLDGSSFHY